MWLACGPIEDPPTELGISSKGRERSVVGTSWPRSINQRLASLELAVVGLFYIVQEGIRCGHGLALRATPILNPSPLAVSSAMESPREAFQIPAAN